MKKQITAIITAILICTSLTACDYTFDFSDPMLAERYTAEKSYNSWQNR